MDFYNVCILEEVRNYLIFIMEKVAALLELWVTCFTDSFELLLFSKHLQGDVKMFDNGIEICGMLLLRQKLNTPC